jgi:hypothetical protein
MLIGVYLLLLAAYGAWEAQEGQGLWPIALVIGIALLVAGGCYFAFQSLFRTRIRVYRNGVEVETIWSRSFTRWEDIEAIFEFDPPIERNSLGMEVHNYRCGFSQTDGDTFWFHINRMSGLRDFVARLHKRVDDRFRARARAALAAGEVAWFGPVGIGRDGIHSHKGDVLPWSEVSFAGCVHDTHFEVLKKGSNWGWFSRKISDVENVAILNELIKSRKEWMSPA